MVDLRGGLHVVGGLPGHLRLPAGVRRRLHGWPGRKTLCRRNTSRLFQLSWRRGPRRGHRPGGGCAGGIYLAGNTSSYNFPTSNAYKPDNYSSYSDAFVTKLQPDGTALVFSTFFGGQGDDGALDIAIDAAGDIHLAGQTASVRLPAGRSRSGTGSRVRRLRRATDPRWQHGGAIDADWRLRLRHGEPARVLPLW